MNETADAITRLTEGLAALVERWQVTEVLWAAWNLQDDDHKGHVVVIPGHRSGYGQDTVASTWPDPPNGTRPYVNVPTGHLL